MSRDKTLSALNAALESCGLVVMTDIGRRIPRAGDLTQPTALMERAGIRRSLHSYMEEAIGVARPDWSRVRALHKAWVLSAAWCREGDSARKGDAT